MQPASFAQRAIGRAIDMFIVFSLSLLALLPFYENADDGDTKNTAPVLFVAAVILAVAAYEIVPVHLRGQTPGKLLARTCVVRTEGGGLPSIGSAMLRWLPVVFVLVVGSAISTPLTIVVIAVLYLSALADPDGRHVLDKLARTRVVRVDRATAD